MINSLLIKSLLLLVPLLLVALVVGYYFLSSDSSDKLQFETGSGSVIMVNNFVDNSKNIKNGQVIIFDKPNSAKFVYDKKRMFYLLFNESNPEILKIKMDTAVKDIQESLGISLEQACSLPLEVYNTAFRENQSKYYIELESCFYESDEHE